MQIKTKGPEHQTKTLGRYRVTIMADSIIRFLDGSSHRLTTFRLLIPRIVLAEFNTHRLFSRNSASSRARPGSKMRHDVRVNPFIPMRFPKDHKGMQASNWYEAGSLSYKLLKVLWYAYLYILLGMSALINRLGVSKQLTNRFVEVMAWQEVVVSSTEYENFTALRASGLAQDEIRIVAELMIKAMNESVPVDLAAGEWHLPFGDTLNYDRLAVLYAKLYEDGGFEDKTIEDLAAMVTVARCARVSYVDFEGHDDYEKDYKLCLRLMSSGHWSPFEHVARAMSEDEYSAYSHTKPGVVEKGWCANFRGFIQLRSMQENESQHDPRILAK